MYTHINFKTKKALKEAVAEWNKYAAMVDEVKAGTITSEQAAEIEEPPAITYYQPGPFGGNETKDGTIFLEGPHYPEAHKWYAQATAENGIIVKVK